MFNPYNWYRISSFLFRRHVPIIPIIISYLIRFVFSAWIPASSRIGRGVVFGYGGLGVVIHDRSEIGDGCHIDQHVTIGGTSKKYEVPVLGRNVYVGAGAKILGPIRIGSEVVIGANSVVITDVPDNSLVVGVPGRVIKTGIAMSDYV